MLSFGRSSSDYARNGKITIVVVWTPTGECSSIQVRRLNALLKQDKRYLRATHSRNVIEINCWIHTAKANYFKSYANHKMLEF